MLPPWGTPTGVCRTTTLVLTLATLLPACQPPAGVTGTPGTYRLVSVDRRELPARVNHGQASLEIRQGTFTFAPDGTCQSSIRFVAPTGREVVRETSATYTQSGPDVSMRWKGAGRTEGRREGDLFTMTNEGMLFTYRSANDPH